MTTRLHQGRVAIVTGSNGGLGVEIARRLASEGADLVLGDVNGANLAAHAEVFQREHGVRVSTFVGDLGTEAGAQGLIATAIEAFGRADILVNNAGGGLIRPFLSHTVATLEETLRRNLWTVLLCTHAVLPHMVAAGYGRIVHVGADSVRNGLPSHAGYNAAKGGVHGLTTGLAREFARDGITVNTVAPCAVSTPQLVELNAKDPALVERFVSIIPMGRAAEMAEVASMVSYVASEQAAFVTGQVISVNGGSTMP